MRTTTDMLYLRYCSIFKEICTHKRIIPKQIFFNVAIVQVTQKASGTYILRVNSSMFRHYDIEFTIKVVEPASSTNTVAIVGGFLASLLMLTWIAIVTVWKVKKQRERRCFNRKFFLTFLLYLNRW